MQEFDKSTTLVRRWTIALLVICFIGLMLIVIFSEIAFVFLLIPAALASALIGAILGLIISAFSKKRAKRDVFRKGRRGALIGLTAAVATVATTIVTLRLLEIAGGSDS